MALVRRTVGRAAERLTKVLAFLKAAGLLSVEREHLLLSWNHHTGFNVHDDVVVEPEDRAGLERLARYLLRPPVSLERMEWAGSASEVTYRSYDDFGFCMDCGKFYCSTHWEVSSTGAGWCPAGHGKSLDPHWHPDWDEL